jgi:hypothetical protein
MGRTRILAAVSRLSLPLLSELLEGWCDFTPVHTMQDALEHARRGGFDLVLIGQHFDGSRMPLLLEMLKFWSATRALPVVCCRMRPTVLPTASVRAARLVCEALGAEAFVDVLAVRNWAGRAAAAARLKTVLRRALQAHGHAPGAELHDGSRPP